MQKKLPYKNNQTIRLSWELQSKVAENNFAERSYMPVKYLLMIFS